MANYSVLEAEFWLLSFRDVASPALMGICTIILMRPLIGPSMDAELFTELLAEERRGAKCFFCLEEGQERDLYFFRSKRQCLHSVGLLLFCRFFRLQYPIAGVPFPSGCRVFVLLHEVSMQHVFYHVFGSWLKHLRQIY
ncbi:hypothetical protein [Thermoactinomyces mirandus]|uniref:Uncharacterized protein n=1 Tax=Thermoactinomyces mirandus TaxID=2756294 RepID=A0A7W2ARF6_9BACL|nr:hypothetical protein [Thermoactinomyces mirandus]MBA4602513.1 hypothetical protein [Thermoactinomyces mirandus]